MADIGYIALFLALAVSLYSGISFLVGARRGSQAILASACNGLVATAGLVSLCVAILLYGLLAHDFSFEYVASYTDRSLPVAYLVSALWAGNSGSLLFWAWLLSLVALIAFFVGGIGKTGLRPYAASVLILTESFFLLLLLVAADPFVRLIAPPADGLGLNPMLQNPGMIIHPPALLAGYVVLAAPFAIAVAALLTGDLDDEWTVPARKWMLVAWLLLGAGNLIGAWWAYVELGWGGYWAWDPVENAGLMPWLISTAFLHSLMMQRRRGMLKVWNMSLVILAFILSIFGTFLTRSDVLSSVHTFGESGMEIFFILFITAALLFSFYLVYYRRGALTSESEIKSLVSRESVFLLTNLLLVGSTIVIFMGTIFPALSEALMGSRLTVGKEYYNQVDVPIFMAIILLAGICTFLGWKRALFGQIYRSLLWPFSATVITGLLIIILGVRDWYAVGSFSLCALVIYSISYQWLRGTRAGLRTRAEGFVQAFWRQISRNRVRYGAYVIHFAIAVMAIGIIGSSLYSIEKEALLKTGESVSLKNYTLTYQNITQQEQPDKLVLRASLAVAKDGRAVSNLYPEKYFHKSYEQPVTEVAIRSTLGEDLYVILDSTSRDGTTFFKVLVNPLVNWIWIGGAVLILGGIIVFWPERGKRRPVLKTTARS